jgi:hypothetical protein
MPKRKGPKRPTDPRARRGSGTVRLKGKNWEARWSEGGTRKTKGGFSTKDDAVRFIEDRSGAVLTAKGLADLGLPLAKPAASPKSFHDLLPEFMEYRRAHKYRSVADDESRWQQHLAHLGDRMPSALTVADVETLAARVARTPKAERKQRRKGPPAPPLSGATVRLVLHLLSAFYKWGMKHHRLNSNPAREALTETSVRRVVGHHKPDWD